VAGEVIAVRSVVVMRGASNPLVVLVTSSMALLLGVAPVVLKATCACVIIPVKRQAISEHDLIFIVSLVLEFERINYFFTNAKVFL
jgi:hypothetical protein